MQIAGRPLGTALLEIDAAIVRNDRHAVLDHPLKDVEKIVDLLLGGAPWQLADWPDLAELLGILDQVAPTAPLEGDRPETTAIQAEAVGVFVARLVGRADKAPLG